MYCSKRFGIGIELLRISTFKVDKAIFSDRVYFVIWRNIGDMPMRDFMDVIRAVGDENRVRALMALRGRELCVCQIIELLELAPSTVSKHMSILKQARLVDTRKSGRWVFYRLAGNGAVPEVEGAIAWLCKSLQKDSLILQDDDRLQEILKWDLSVLCASQSKKVNEIC
jgi:DNA-binding transcriptional ArsR family regulator